MSETTPLLKDPRHDNGTFAQHEHPVDSEQAVPHVPPPIQTRALISTVLPLAIGIFLAAMDQTIVVSSYASIGTELRQLQKTSWIATSYMLTLAAFQPLYGKLSDIFGRKFCLLTAYSIFALGSLLCGLARTMDELIIARALAGVGGGGMTTVVSIIMSDIVPLRSRGTWQGVLNIVFASGSATGAPLGGFMADSVGWRWAFLMQVPIALLAITSVSVALHLPHTSNTNFKAKIKRIDFAGAIALILTIFSLLYALERGGNASWSDKLTVGALCFFVLFFAVFGYVEMKVASEPFAPKRIVASRTLIAGYLTNLFTVAAAMAMIFHVTLYLQVVQRKSASEAGLWLVPNILGGVAGSLAGGLAIQATGKFYWLTAASTACSLGGLSVVVSSTGVIMSSMIAIIFGLIMTSLGNGSAITTSLISLIANAGPEDQAIATAVSYLFRSLGSVLGISVASTITQSVLSSSLRQNLKSGHDIDDLVQRVRESLKYIQSLDPETRIIVETSYEHAIHAALWFSVAMGACCMLSSLFIKEKALPSRKQVATV